jgi:tritrans,polycis-undecaprenyl-diphosphate synthase [geranylgeranyl-diphosphate specific]
MENVPKHVAIILDGNRRFAKKLMLKPWKGHEWGAKKVEQLLEWLKEFGIDEITLYAFSMQNFNRPKEEFNFLMNIFKEMCESLLTDKRVEENDIRVRFIGRIGLFPKDLTELMHQVMEKTKNNTQHTINLAMAYGGREEIIDAVIALSKDVKEGKVTPEQVNEALLKSYLYMPDEPELIIRTGGEKRTSNFLPWQGIYSEWFFLEKTWPEFEKEDLLQCIEEYQIRERRFGK